MLKRWRFWLGIIVSLFFLYLAFRGQDLAHLGEELRGPDYRWLIPAVAVYFVAVFVRTLRWRYLLWPVKVIPSSRLFPVVVIGYAGNNVLPLRAGEVIRAFMLRRKEGTSASAALATILVERIFDGLTMLLFIAVSAVLISLQGSSGQLAANRSLQQLVTFMSLVFFGVLAAFFLLAAFPQRMRKLYSPVIDKLVPGRFQEQGREIFGRFLEGLQVLRSGKDVLLIFAFSVILWLLEATKYVFVMQGFPFRQPFYVLMLTTAVVNLAAAIPSTPGYLGTFEAAGIATLQLFAVEREIASSFIVVLHAALYFPITLLGLFLMWREGLSWHEVGEMKEGEGGELCASESSVGD